MNEKTNTNNNEWANREVGALWRKESATQKYFSGHIRLEDEFGEEQTLQVVIFRNKHKQKDNHPDFRIYKSKPMKVSTSGEKPPSSEKTGDVEESSGVQEVAEEDVL